ncbi:uncharacterized protein BO80DRAFT_449887 [Aspergillus ibericus CBS 121593]|uniref:Uncharacterized protein n=1 Tax=Aspergillus ibericus CBS 121593 TaxID=1448316 RepID=A0A395GJV4_9EURO|nr:hypothetical protein BO80DRAFT_449887 [Aspergillus ibericus CBS 121593]RAK95771.1 hypothetical protein BO80DRAFT_449887 [Aspergillus ibericus CBS 121593]
MAVGSVFRARLDAPTGPPKPRKRVNTKYLAQHTWFSRVPATAHGSYPLPTSNPLHDSHLRIAESSLLSPT